jgi:hypothetical protein
MQDPTLQSTMGLNNEKINITKVLQDFMLQFQLCLKKEHNQCN